jgi:hypothetical protein
MKTNHWAFGDRPARLPADTAGREITSLRERCKELENHVTKLEERVTIAEAQVNAIEKWAPEFVRRMHGVKPP